MLAHTMNIIFLISLQGEDSLHFFVLSVETKRYTRDSIIIINHFQILIVCVRVFLVGRNGEGGRSGRVDFKN